MTTPEDSFEPARRELCPDGSCIGLIGPDGRCKVCGTVSPSAVSDPRHQGMVAPRADSDEVDDDDRDLCPDGACIGLIGPDGRCNVCGRPGDGKAAAAVAAALPTGEGALEVEDGEDRELCPDGNCIGLIGPDGRCKVCGVPRESTPG
jgi:hypothetical protein